MARIAYYAHYYGSGHCRYADYIASLVTGGIPVFSSREFTFNHARPILSIPDEEFDHSLREHHLITLPNYLHYSPVGVDKIRQRSLQILQKIGALELEIIVVDISVEIAALLRVSSVPYLYVRLFGDRRDTAHEEAFRGAMGLLAYFPEELESKLTPEWVRKKTKYLGFKPTLSASAPVPPDIGLLPQSILFIRGFGEAEALEEAIVKVKEKYPDRPLVGIGEFSTAADKLLTRSLGVVADILPYLATASVVVASCGSNLTAEILRSGRPFVPIPCQRPYAEQREIAAAVCSVGLGTSLADFLSGHLVQGPLPGSLSTENYRSFFAGLAATTDWRKFLGVKLEYVPIAGHDM